MREPDIRWDGWSHKDICDRVHGGPSTAVTERLEARLTSTAKALNDISDLVNATLQRVDGGEWTGSAASAAAEAMRVMRDFDDIMGHHSTVNTLAAYGQSDNAAWARANVPPYVDMRAAQVPTGLPLDAVNATADHQHQLQVARDAEERARQVMREYERMTTARIAALPPLSPAPQVVISTGGDDIIAPSGGPDTPPVDSVRRAEPRPDVAAPKAEVPTTPSTPGAAPRPTAPAEPTPSQRPSPNRGESTQAAATAPSGFEVRTGAAGQASTTGRDGGQAGGGLLDARPGGDGLRGAHPGDQALRAGGRGGVTEVLGQAARGGGPFGTVPGGTGRTDEDKERRTRYTVPGSEIFEPDNDDGLLHDPFRPGSYVAPASIGDEDE